MNDEGEKFINIDQLLTPFWEGREVFDETIMLASKNGGQAKAKLFYTPEKFYQSNQLI